MSGSVWKDTATVITPVTSGDSLDMGTGPVTAASYLLTYAADTYINPKTSTGNNGSNLHFVGGAGLDPSNPKTGGSAYIYGGAGVNGGLNGSTLICYDGTTWRGRLGIGGAADSAYLVKISGDLWVTGTFKYDATPGGGGGAGAGAGAMIMNSSGEVISPTFKQLMDAVVGSTVTAKSVLWFNGTSYSAIALGASSDKYLRVNSSLDLEVADLVLTGKVVDASVSAGAALSWSKMATLATSTIPALDAGGLMVSSGVAAGKLTYLTNVSSDIQGQLDAVVRNVISSNIIIANTVFTDANLPNQITLDTTGGSKTATLPLISTLTDGTVVELSQYGANTGTIAKNAGDTAFVDKTGADVATLVLSGAGGYAKLRCDHATSSWYVLAWI